MAINPTGSITLINLVKLLDRTRPVTIRFSGEDKPLDAWVLAACDSMTVKSIDIVEDGYLITVEKDAGFGLFPLFNGCRTSN